MKLPSGNLITLFSRTASVIHFLQKICDVTDLTGNKKTILTSIFDTNTVDDTVYTDVL